MSREIKFRGINIKTKKWIYGDLYSTSEVPMIVKDGIASEFDNFIVVNSETVGQYTGIKDKNGKEIYEGDICKHHRHEVIGNWIYSEKYCSFALCEDYIDTNLSFYCRQDEKYLEVIGNIYENPELLEGEKQ